MKIEQNKLIYEIVTCWDCEGSGITDRYSPCPDHDKKTYGKPCTYCGAKNRHSHRHSKIPHQEPCQTCQGIGKRQENKFDSVSQPIIDYIFQYAQFHNGKDKEEGLSLDSRFLVSCYSGINSFAGSQDYTDHRQDTVEQLKTQAFNDLKDGERTLQALNYVNKEGNIILDYHCIGYNGGWSIEFNY